CSPEAEEWTVPTTRKATKQNASATRATNLDTAIYRPLFPSPALGERRHSIPARRSVAVRRRAIFMLHPRFKGRHNQLIHYPYRRRVNLQDAADDGAIGKHDAVVVVPLAGGAGSRGALRISSESRRIISSTLCVRPPVAVRDTIYVSSGLAGLLRDGHYHRECPMKALSYKFGRRRRAVQPHVRAGIGNANEQSRRRSERPRARPKRAVC